MQLFAASVKTASGLQARERQSQWRFSPHGVDILTNRGANFAMITLHHCAGARSFRALWTLEEMGLPYELKLMAFPPRAREPDYLALNPLGTVPAFFDDGVLMTELAAICHYLATRHGPTPLAVAPDEPGYGAYLNFLHMGEATLTFPQTIVLRYTRLEPPERRVPQAAADLRAVVSLAASGRGQPAE